MIWDLWHVGKHAEEVRGKLKLEPSLNKKTKKTKMKKKTKKRKKEGGKMTELLGDQGTVTFFFWHGNFDGIRL